MAGWGWFLVPGGMRSVRTTVAHSMLSPSRTPAYHIDDRVAAVAANVERAVRRNIKALGIVELVVRGSSNPLLARDIGRLYV